MAFAKDLRASVLQAAMQGKLTEQSETDTPVSELLADISTKTKKKITLLEDDDLPTNWGSVKITDVVTLYTGNSISESVKTAKYCGLKEGYDYIGTKDVNFDHTICYDNGVKIPFNEPNFRYAEKDATLLCIEGGSAGRKIAILDKKVCFGNKLCAFHPIDIESKFLYFFLQSPQFLGVFANNISGIIGGVSINKIKQMTLPIPPIEEQKRIVRRIEEIMKHIDELEAIEEELKKLKEVFPADMKAAVLQAAMQGKLTEQLETDSSVDDLLEDIKKEREKLVKEGKIKKSRTAQNDNFVQLDDIPFEIPSSWKWVKLGDLLSVISDGTHKTPNYVEKGVPFLSVQNISTGSFTFDKIKYISKEEHDELCKRIKPEKGDILLCRIGTLGKALKNTLDFEFSIFVSLGLLRPILPIITDFLILSINSPVGYKWIQENKVGGGTHTFKINLNSIPEMYIPLPPVEEQQRIVDKLETILPLIDGI